jgi:hypothetical protein
MWVMILLLAFGWLQMLLGPVMQFTYGLLSLLL